jgi:hypothetical protein
MKKYKMNYKRLPVYLTLDIYNAVEVFAKNNKESLSNVARDLITKGIRQEVISENINVVSDVVRRVVRDVIRAETDRLAKLIVKNMKASAASMYQGAQIVEDIGQNKGKDILENSIKMAVEYIKTSFDSDNISFGSHGKEQNNEQFDDDDF